ncbi:MAG TPA: amidase [Terriglobales bacterium]|nr:amidase [Terriglobales bacterium]
MAILEAAAQLRKRAVSAVELVQQCLNRVEKLNPVLNAFITVTAESALEAARIAEKEIGSGNWRSPLHGIPIGLKDIIDTAGTRTTAASALFKDRIPAEDADVVHRLKAAGAIIIGKQNLHEFAYGGSSLISHFGAVRNPWNPEHIAGGSSGGSAAAVAAGMCYASIGTDTGGSVRLPAALCGIVGFKPTYGRVSTRGVIPLSQSLDHVGPLTTSVADAAAVFDAIVGDSTTVADRQSEAASRVRDLRVGIPRQHFFDNLHLEVASAVDAAVSVIRGLVANVRDINLSVNPDRPLLAAEAYAYHARYVSRSPELYDPETLRRLRAGERFSEKERSSLKAEMEKERRNIRAVFEDVDVLITPTVPVPAPTIAELRANPEALRPAEIRMLPNTHPFNAWGLPAISVPCGFTKAGLLIGLQIAGPASADNRVLALAHAYEQATEWHDRHPPL